MYSDTSPFSIPWLNCFAIVLLGDQPLHTDTFSYHFLLTNACDGIRAFYLSIKSQVFYHLATTP